MYFDSVARVDVANWALGRIALLGDASSCVSLFGDGSTLAMAGAYQLATTLTESPTDPRGAFRRYQAVHGKLVASKQKNLARVASRIVPKTETGIWLSTRVFWRTLQAVGTAMRMGRKLRRQ
jgi:2-polyprenyl-6-methoxyphenol hydroxylase-like FAD-dependent oxidoreductase